MGPGAAPADAGNGDRPSARLRIGVLWLPLFLLVVLHLGGLARDQSAVLNGVLNGPDSYMRLARVAALAESGDWYGSVFSRSNVPFGEAQHWTRPFDVVLLAGGAVLGLGPGFEFGLHLWGVTIGPILHFVTLLALFWAARGLLDRQTLFLMGLMALFQASVFYQFLPGRADHHGLQALVFVVLLGLGLRLLAWPLDRRLPLLAGLVAGLAIWISVEGALGVAIVLAALTVAWLVDGGDRVLAPLRFSLATVSGLAVALAVERPPAAWLAAEFDRISIVQLWAFALVAAFWLCVWAWRRGGVRDASRPARAFLLIAGLTLAAAAMGLSYPRFFAGPMADVPVAVRALWLAQISELISPLAQPRPGDAVYLLCLYLGAVFPALLYLPWLLRRSAGTERRRWLLLLLALVVTLALSLYQLRWSTYAQLAALPVYAALLGRTLAALGLRFTVPGDGPRPLGRVLVQSLARVLVLLGFGFGFIAVGWLAKPSGVTATGGDSDALVRACDVGAASRFLAEPSSYGERPRRIMTYVFDGPELLYRTPHQVVGTPYHRNGAGILDTHGFFAARDADAARRIVARRGIELVLLCPSGSERLFYAREGEVILLDRLATGEAPAWLRPVALPPPLAGQYLLFEVAF